MTLDGCGLSHSLSRRKLLSLTAACATGSLAGCSGDTSQRSCPEGYMDLDQANIEPAQGVGTGPLDGFELSLERETIRMGEELRARVENVSDAPRESRHKVSFDVQYHRDETWESVYGMNHDTVQYQDVAVRHQPGEGFTYSMPFTEDGLSNPTDHWPSLHVCGQLDPGEYRFIYWGVGDVPPTETRSGPSETFQVIARSTN